MLVTSRSAAYFFFFSAFAHLAFTAFRAAALLCSGVKESFLFFAPIRPASLVVIGFALSFMP